MSVSVLTLFASAAWKEAIVAAMLSHAPTAKVGFTTRDVEGHGQFADYASSVEQVRGHSLSVEIIVVAPDADLKELIEVLRGEFAGRGVTWRIARTADAGLL